MVESGCVETAASERRVLMKKKSDSSVESFYDDLAGRFRALSQFFGQLGSREAAQQLLESLISGDAKTFARLIEPLEIPNFPQLGKCFWIREIIERLVVTPAGLVDECWVRDDL